MLMKLTFLAVYMTSTIFYTKADSKAKKTQKKIETRSWLDGTQIIFRQSSQTVFQIVMRQNMIFHFKFIFWKLKTNLAFNNINLVTDFKPYIKSNIRGTTRQQKYNMKCRNSTFGPKC